MNLLKTGDIYTHAQTVCTRPLLGGRGAWDRGYTVHNVKVFSLNSAQVMDITKSNSEEVIPANPTTQEIWADTTQPGHGV